MAPFSRLMHGLGALGMLSAVALGAFGAHALRGRLPPDAMAIFKTGVDYHFYHALALFAVGYLAERLPRSRLLRWAGALIAAGIPLFSGTLYMFVLTGTRGWAMVTPLGGTAWLAAWTLIAIAVWRHGSGGDA
jgi:uncharacterized membrane protein YgdD (TMEM256/DUF423 family)